MVSREKVNPYTGTNEAVPQGAKLAKNRNEVYAQEHPMPDRETDRHEWEHRMRSRIAGMCRADGIVNPSSIDTIIKQAIDENDTDESMLSWVSGEIKRRQQASAPVYIKGGVVSVTRKNKHEFHFKMLLANIDAEQTSVLFSDNAKHSGLFGELDNHAIAYMQFVEGVEYAVTGIAVEVRPHGSYYEIVAMTAGDTATVTASDDLQDWFPRDTGAVVSEETPATESADGDIDDDAHTTRGLDWRDWPALWITLMTIYRNAHPGQEIPDKACKDGIRAAYGVKSMKERDNWTTTQLINKLKEILSYKGESQMVAGTTEKPAITKAEWENFFEVTGYSSGDTLKALGVSRLSEWTGTLAEADEIVKFWLKDRAKQGNSQGNDEMTTEQEIRRRYNKPQHGNDYLVVQGRILLLRLKHPYWTIDTSVVFMDSTEATFKATICNEEGRIIATGHGRATKEGTKHVSGRFVEKAETSAMGRALATAGFGTDDTLDDSDYIADSPISK